MACHAQPDHRRVTRRNVLSHASQENLHTESQRETEAAWYSDKGRTLPVFPGDVRDSMGSPPGGPESPVHLHRSTLPHFFSASQFGAASNVVASVCAASR